MARRKRLSRNKRLAIVLTVIILLVLIAPQFIRYYMNVADANAAAKQEKAYIAKVGKQQATMGATDADKLPVTSHWDLNANGEMKVVVSSKAMSETDGQALVWVNKAAEVWNKAMGVDFIKVTSTKANQNENVDRNVWPDDADYQLLIGYKDITDDLGKTDTTVLATTTEAGNTMWISKQAAKVWLAKTIQREDYLSGAVYGPVTSRDIEDLHNQEAEHTIIHEFGHALALKHQGQANDLMSPMVGINDLSKPNATEVMQVKTIRYLAMNPDLMSEDSYNTVFRKYYQQLNGQDLPNDLVVLNDSHE
ncbi:hypothetical protein ACAW68_08330 [Weissella confusa]|uniref:hypothetical protein n=1 Tax=Weissella confusa TaxID=1583 RepID=UPI0035A3CE1E